MDHVTDTHHTQEYSPVISDTFLSEVKHHIQQENMGVLKTSIEALDPADLGFLLERLSSSERQALVGYFQKTFDPEFIANLSPSVFASVVEQVGLHKLATLLPKLDSDDAFAIYEELDDAQQRALLKVIPRENRLIFEDMMQYPEDSAARIMQKEVVMVPSFWTVGATIQYLQRATDLPEQFYEIFVLDAKHKPVGRLPLNSLLRNDSSLHVSKVMDPDVHYVTGHTAQEEVAYLFRHYDLVSMPVVDHENKIMGMITADDIVDVIDEEAQKEIMQITGVDNSDVNAPVLRTSYHRMASLMVTFVNSFILAVIVFHFEPLIAKHVVLVGLMPIVAGMSGASGTQVIAVTVRSLATKMISKGNTFKIIMKEVLIGSINGLFFSMILMLILVLWYKDWTLGFVLICALSFNMIWAAFSGAALPIIVDRLGLDPAVSTGPMLSALTDVIGFVSLLALASWLL